MQKQSLYFEKPLMNAAGSLGFSPDSRGPIDTNKLGAFITNPISMKSRKAAKGPRLIHYAAGALFHTGHPNPGLNSILKAQRSNWARAGLPIIVHLLASTPDENANMIESLEEIENVVGIEIGFPHDADEKTTSAILASAQGELPIMARISLSNAQEIGRIAFEAGASLISIGPPRGALTMPTGEEIFGRLYGPSLFPQVRAAVSNLVALNIPVVGGGGVFAYEQAEELLEAGAVGVQLDTILWQGDFFGNE